MAEVVQGSADSLESTRIQTAYDSFFIRYQAVLGHYFRNLYNVLKYVKNSDMENKRVYTNLVRAQLSSDELVLLFYDCLSAYGKNKFKPIVEEFALLNNLDERLVFDQSHLSLYSQSAYSSAEADD